MHSRKCGFSDHPKKSSRDGLVLIQIASTFHFGEHPWQDLNNDKRQRHGKWPSDGETALGSPERDPLRIDKDKKRAKIRPQQLEDKTNSVLWNFIQVKRNIVIWTLKSLYWIDHIKKSL